MSQIPSKQIDGDVAIVRNVAIGNNAIVRGSATIGHNLRVEGWLDAPNIKGPNKGLFKTADQLREAYQNPNEGWWALVGSTLPAQVYLADGGEWVAQTNSDGTPKLAGELTVDISTMKGQPNGIAPLDDNGKVPAAHLPGFVDDVKEFSGFVSGVSRETQTSSKNSTDSGCSVVFDTSINAFLLRVDDDPTGGILSGGATYHNNWADRSMFGSATGLLCIPSSDKVYIDKTTNRTYRWSGENMVIIGSDLALGYTESTAFPGNEGLATKLLANNLTQAMNMLEADVSTAKAVTDSKAKPSGIAPLNENSIVPAEHLPREIYDYIEFNAVLDVEADVTVQTTPSEKKSTDAGCLVVYNPATKKFLLAVCKDILTEVQLAEWNFVRQPLRMAPPSTQLSGYVTFVSSGEARLVESKFNYFSDWADAAKYGESKPGGRCPEGGKLYVATYLSNVYGWDGTRLRVIASRTILGSGEDMAYPGTHGEALSKKLAKLERQAVLPCDGEWNGQGIAPSEGVWLCPAGNDGVVFRSFGNTDFYGLSESTYNDGQNYSPGHIYRIGDELFRISNGTFATFSGSTDGNCLNVTVEIPKSNTTNPYYDLASAIAAVFAKDRAKLGLQITFAATASTWKQYQYIGATLVIGDFCNEANWIDMAGTSAGTEPVVNINDLCGEPTAADYYSFESAIDALAEYEADTKVIYRKAGMVITYRVSSSKWETLQLVQKVTDFGNRAAWKEFGGGGSEVIAKDTPEAGGKDALSTGGAYNALPTQHEVIQEDGTVTVLFKNAGGDPVMEPLTFLASTGGGGEVSGTVVSIKFRKSPLFGALGSDIKAQASIRSITMAGATEVDNAIAQLELIDRDTNITVWSENVNKPSSTTGDDYSFDIDFTPFMTQAGQRRFTLRATDETGHSTTKYITVTAEDVTVTVSGVQVLHVRNDAMITPSMTRATFDLFKFENNQSDKGIEAVVEMLIDDEWVEVHRSTVNDSFTKAITINPNALGLGHGAYPLRVSGTSLNSGVKGNTVYTAVMVVDPDENTPMVAIRYDDRSDGTVRLYDSVNFDVAVYNPAGANTIINTKASNSLISQLLCDNTRTYNVRKQIQGFADGDVVKLYAKVVSASDLRDFRSYEVPLTVSGSVIEASLKEGALYSFDFSSRSNAEADHSIVDGNFRLDLAGANYTTNGFVNYLGQNCLRIAENVTGSINHMPVASAALEATGMAWQCQFATNNIKDADAMLLECYDPISGAGFYIKGNKAGIYCRNGNQAREERAFPCGEQVTLGITVEPSSVYVGRAGVRYSAIRMYLNGDLVAQIGYIPGRGDLFNPKNITMNGKYGDLYLYYILAYQTYYEWAQAFKNYLVKLPDTAAMIEEFNAENVLVSQTAEGSTEMRPSAAALWARGIPYVVLVADDETFDTFDNGTSTSDNFEMTVYYYDPARPWRSFKATNCRIRRQGTTSAKRCKKNVRIYLSKASEITPLFPDYTNADALLTYALFAKKKIRVGEKTMAIDLITIKVDYSDAGGANDCGVCDMMNATYRALGDDYMTPAQRFFDGTQDIDGIHLEGLELNHSTANHPIAVFRSTSDTLQNVYFEAKGNWKEDKGEQTALGFINTPGYNLGCRNYQDNGFTEYYGLPSETLAQTEARFRADTTKDPSKLYLLSEYCGNRYRFMKYVDGQWAVMTGSMKQTAGKGTKSWTVSGYVLNPVTGFELLTYQELNWWRGVDSLEKMMQTGTGKVSSWVQKLIDKGKVTADVVPLWTYYFECMVDNDDLAIAYAQGRKVPFELYRVLRFCDSSDPDKHPDTYFARAKANFYKFLNVRSMMVYYAATDYNSLYDQQAKNMQPMFFLEDGCRIENGVYYDDSSAADDCVVDTLPARSLPERMYFNKVYDADGANGKDNDGGCTGDPECDPAKPTDETTGYANPYAGWNSILWVVLRAVQEFKTDDAGGKTDLRTIVAAMRSVEALVDGRNLKPFSPEGATYFFLTKRLRRWPKMVSSYDGIRKYVKYTATSDAIYFYALQGLGLTSLPDFIEKRWRIRDGYYQTGAFFTGYITARIGCAQNAKIRITAAKTGYFGIGNDNTGAVTESVYLEAGQSHEFTNFSHQTGALLYIYQTDRMSGLDLSEVSLGSSNGEIDFSIMKLVQSLKLGSATHSEVPTGYIAMTSAKLGNLPFLENLDVRKTGLQSVDCSGCPRLAHLDARDTSVMSFTVAETSPINDIAMPGTLTDLSLVGLPQLTFSGLNADSGFRVPSLAKVQSLRMETSPNLDGSLLLKKLLDCQSGNEDGYALRYLRATDVAMSGDGSELSSIMELGVHGVNNHAGAPELEGQYHLTVMLEPEAVSELQDAFPGLTIDTDVAAFVREIEKMNAESSDADPDEDVEVPVTNENIGVHIRYYNGETYQEWLSRFANENI